MDPSNDSVHHHSRTRSQDQPVSLALSWARRCLSAPLRESQDRQSRLSARVRQRVARGLCEKPKVKCAACPHRRFLPVTDEVIRWHLAGRDDDGRDFVMGAYPMLCRTRPASSWQPISTRHTGRKTQRVILETCRRMNLTAALERSRSGNGGHVWLFFEEAIPAALARRLGSHILTETMERRPDIGLDSYDRFFPNQDTLPQGGFGNLIALPLQKQPRERRQ